MIKYKISILFDSNENEILIYKGKSHYNDTLFDDLIITNKRIVIEGNRSKNIPKELILINTTSTLYQQILKALVFSYMTTGKPHKILEIKLYKEVKDDQESYSERNILQPYTKSLAKEFCLEPNALNILFSNSSKGHILLNSLILFIKGIEENNFDYYWKSFNCLYSYISGKDKEHEKLKFMRQFIESNSSHFKLSVDLIDLDQKNDIRSLRIRDFILSNFPTRNETNQFKELIFRFSDYRLNEMFQDILPYRKDFLIAEGLMNDVQNHITNSINNRQKANDQLLCFYILKYAYFLRNKYFHAEKTAPVFLLKNNNEVTELNKINAIMSAFLVDLYKCNYLYM